MKFNKKWEESCDELEKFVIYKAAYKAFTVGSTVCAIMWIVVTLCSMIFDYGPVPVAVVSVIWMTLSISYSREAYRLEKEKINE